MSEQADELRVEHGVAESEAVQESRDRDSLRILVVDDSRVTRRMVEKAIRLTGLSIDEVLHAADGEQALACLRGGVVDVVFTDLNMPVMDGAAFLEAVRHGERGKDVAVVVLTSEGGGERLDEVRAWGIEAYIRKPFTPESIRDALESLRVAPPSCRAQGLAERVFADVARRTAFLLCESVLPDVPIAAPVRALHARVEFDGPYRGSLDLWLPADLAASIAADALGVDESAVDDDVTVADAVLELLNVTCGHVLSELVRGGESFRRRPPALAAVDRASWEAARGDSSTSVLVADGQPVLVRLLVQG